jgi:predicted DNA-binding antitoxin AbrB/MazE fold protein
MRQTVQAIYEAGVLRPLQPLDLAERELVSIAIERQAPSFLAAAQGQADAEDWIDHDAVRDSQVLADPTISLAKVRQALSGIVHGDLTKAVFQQRGD